MDRIGQTGRARENALGKSLEVPLYLRKSLISRPGAGSEDRTHIASLEGWNFTVKLCPHRPNRTAGCHNPAGSQAVFAAGSGPKVIGGGRRRPGFYPRFAGLFSAEVWQGAPRASGVARLQGRSSPLCLCHLFCALVHVLWTRDAGREGAHPAAHARAPATSH
jgi:hypothetical protein